jgi:hypothetical protein
MMLGIALQGFAASCLGIAVAIVGDYFGLWGGREKAAVAWLRLRRIDIRKLDSHVQPLGHNPDDGELSARPKQAHVRTLRR